MTSGFRLMAVHAHPDDEASKGSATMARYLAEGNRVHVVTCTGGERGDVLNPRLADDPRVKSDLVDQRRQEMAASRDVVGYEHTWLGFVDSGLPEGDPLPPLPPGCFALEPLDVTTEALVRVIREFRPHVVTTYDENGGYPHPDHIMTHRVSMRAVDLAADGTFAPELGEPWEVLKVYYNNGFSRQRFAAIARYMTEQGMGSEELDAWLERFDERDDRLLTTRVDVRDYLAIRDEALRAHATQVDPDGFFFAVPHDVLDAAWPTDDYELRMSRIGVTLPETDLFAGIR